MHRIDEHEVGTRAGGVHQQFAQVPVVAHAPRFGGAHRIHLRHPSPALVRGEGLGYRNGCRRAQQCDVDVALAARFAIAHMQCVVADLQIVADREVVDVHVAIMLAEGEREGIGRVAAVFERESDVRLPVLGVQRRAGGGAEELDDGGRHQAFVRLVASRVEIDVDELRGGGVDAERAEHRDEHCVANLHIGAELVYVAGGHTAPLGELDERSCESLGAFLTARGC